MLPTFWPWLWTMLKIAFASSVACVPEDVVAYLNKLVHCDEGLPVDTFGCVFTHVARMFASVLILVCGATLFAFPFTAASAVPFASFTMLFAFANAAAIAVSPVASDDTLYAFVANPPTEYAKATVVTSLITR